MDYKAEYKDWTTISVAPAGYYMLNTRHFEEERLVGLEPDEWGNPTKYAVQARGKQVPYWQTRLARELLA